MLRRLEAMGCTHEYITGYNAEDKTSVLPGVHLVVSLLKHSRISILHYGIADSRLAYHLDEYSFRLAAPHAAGPPLLTGCSSSP